MLCFVSATRAKVCPLLHCGTNNSTSAPVQAESRNDTPLKSRMKCFAGSLLTVG